MGIIDEKAALSCRTIPLQHNRGSRHGESSVAATRAHHGPTTRVIAHQGEASAAGLEAIWI